VKTVKEKKMPGTPNAKRTSVFSDKKGGKMSETMKVSISFLNSILES
jgi:hypothetical protein